ncbi:MAG: hypothetical protein IJI22_01615 [Bacilli bacterium]|nr:hypothetical protein [Bacilli bacterium]
MSVNIEAILHPDEAFLDYVPNLFSLYSHDYGIEYIPKMTDRFYDTMYFFDSDPISTYNFCAKLKRFDIPKYVEEEYFDYIKVAKKSHKHIYSNYHSTLISFFKPKKVPIAELEQLDYSCYSTKNVSMLSNSQVPRYVKNQILKRQKDYLKKCVNLGVKPLTDSSYISILESNKRNAEREEKRYLLQNTKWGKRITRKFSNWFNEISVDNIINILSLDSSGATGRIVSSGGVRYSFVYLPVIERLKYQALDNIIFHELRHVVELGDLTAGLSVDVGDQYELINELRTEKNALRDLEALKGQVLWSQEPLPSRYRNEYKYIYSNLNLEEFFDDYCAVLNGLAVNGAISSFEASFGKDNLIKFEELLKRAYSLEKQRTIFSEELKDESAVLVKKLRENFEGK